MIRTAVRALLIIGGVALGGLPLAAYLGGREGLVLPLAALAGAGLASFAAYQVALALRKRIDAIGAPDGATGAADPPS